MEKNAKLDLEKQELRLLKCLNFNHGSLDWRAREACGTADHSILTVFSTLDGRDREENAHKNLEEVKVSRGESANSAPTKLAYRKRNRGL